MAIVNSRMPLSFEIGRRDCAPVPTVCSSGSRRRLSFDGLGSRGAPLAAWFWFVGCHSATAGFRGSDRDAGRGSAWPSREGSGSLAGRARLPLTSQVEGDGGCRQCRRAADARRSRNAVGAARGEPFEVGAAVRPRPGARSREASRPGPTIPPRRTRRPDEADPSRSSPIKDVRIEPGPTSTNTPRPVAVHRLDHVGKPHGAGEMIAQPCRRSPRGRPDGERRRGSNRPGGRGLERATGAPVRANGSRAERPSACGMPTRPAGAGPEFREPRPASSACLTAAARPGDHRLPGTIPVGDLHAGDLANELLDLVRAGQYGRHRAGDALGRHRA